MEPFYKTDNLTVTFGPKPGKGLCLEFVIDKPLPIQTQVLQDIKIWIVARNQVTTHANHALVKQASPFIQGDNEKDWLLLEFWADMHKVLPMVFALEGVFQFKTTWEYGPYAPVSSIKDRELVEWESRYINKEGSLQLYRLANHDPRWGLYQHGVLVDKDTYINDLLERHDLQVQYGRHT